MSKNLKNRLTSSGEFASVPMKWVGPLKIKGPVLTEELLVPMATFETPLWPSVERGARISMLVGGITAVIEQESMTRSFTLEASDLLAAITFAQSVKDSFSVLADVVAKQSRFAKLQDIHVEVVSQLIFIRIAINSGDASGHNMVTKAAEAVLNFLLARDASLKYVSISGNLCTDKKVSAVNGLLGRGRSAQAELVIPRKICQKFLRVTPEQIVELNVRKNLLGSILAGSLLSANAHFANMLLALYLATGQDAANIVEGSQGITFAEVREDQLVFSVKLPNLIVGTVGNGKGLDFVQANLTQLGCLPTNQAGQASQRLAAIFASAVLCGELSLMAALSNPGELIKSHLKLER